MRKIAYVLLFLILFILSGCHTNRFNSKTMYDYIKEYNISNLHFSEHSKLSMLGWEVYIEDGNINNKYNQEMESMDWALGEDSSGKLVLLYVPLNSKYDIIVKDSVFPSVKTVSLEIESYNANSESLCEISNNNSTNKYSRFLSIYDDEFMGNTFFDSVELYSSYIVKVGNCEIDELNYTVSMLYADDQLVIIAYKKVLGITPAESDMIELFRFN